MSITDDRHDMSALYLVAIIIIIIVIIMAITIAQSSTVHVSKISDQQNPDCPHLYFKA